MTLRMGTCMENKFGYQGERDAKTSCPFQYECNLKPGEKRCGFGPYLKDGRLKTHLISVHGIKPEEVPRLIAKAKFLDISGGKLRNETLIKEVSIMNQSLFRSNEPALAQVAQFFPWHTVFVVDFETTGFEADRQGIMWRKSSHF